MKKWNVTVRITDKPPGGASDHRPVVFVGKTRHIEKWGSVWSGEVEEGVKLVVCVMKDDPDTNRFYPCEPLSIAAIEDGKVHDYSYTTCGRFWWYFSTHGRGYLVPTVEASR